MNYNQNMKIVAKECSSGYSAGGETVMIFLPGEDKEENGTGSRTTTHHSSSKT